MTEEPLEGVVKYHAHHTVGIVEDRLGSLPSETRDAALLAIQRFPELDAARTALHDAGLIGISSTGIGYGNISLRLSGSLFLISGSATGASRILGKDGYSLVEDFDPVSNTVSSFGPVQASSESMTHGAIYHAAPRVQCVIHIHSAALFAALLAKDAPHTPESAAYGTPALSQAVATLAASLPVSGSVFVTAGHADGLIAYGETIKAALTATLNLPCKD